MVAMKLSLIALQKIVVLLLALSLFLVVLEGREERSHDVVGAKVYGPSRLPVGDVVGVLRSEVDGSPLMYVVDADGVFNGRGVIPLANVTNEIPRPQKDGGIKYDIEVTVNRMTFKNISNWGRRELLDDYLDRQESLLGTIYDISESQLEELGEISVYDNGKEEKHMNETSVTSL